MAGYGRHPSHINNHKTFLFEYRFDLASDQTDRRSDRPFKKVHKECLITTFMPMVENVGVTLGMFVGFSTVGFW